MEIMNEANTIINKIVDNENIILAQPIERHGDKVEHWKVDSENSKIIKKGLEFDSVIISDSNKYSENILDTKLLYVACTRAMHTLDIISK